MCLDKITKRHTRPYNEEWQVGYKFFKVSDGEIRFVYFDNEPMELGIVYTASPRQVNSPAGSYFSGFHFFKEKKNLPALLEGSPYVIAKVKVHNITTSGEEYYFSKGDKVWFDVGVASEMEIVKIYK